MKIKNNILGHIQRGGTPSAVDRLLATQLGTACVEMINNENYGVMMAIRGTKVEAVPLEEVIGKRKIIPLDHDWVETAKNVGISLGA
ncbi:6-phosphofructokinase [Candidatus Marithrix sp. Canyon 246]|uniref:6-phosphofructokinase n=1 Tax=Candidatus Marithrix sp. Canyon 246 TaxID=1827136 RepID=UPI00084A2DB1|nr:6-phosphofructokinase [Candidatus Marithrix sp. Canyon 246]